MALRYDRRLAERLHGRPHLVRPRLLAPRAARRGVARQGQSIRLLAIPRWMYRGYCMANAGDLAAAVAFNAMVSLVPTVLLLFSIAGLILRNDDVLVPALHASVWAFTPERTHTAIDAILEAREHTGWYGALSLIGFAWIGSNFVSCLARSMNRIYGVRNRRFVHQRPRDFFVVLLFAIFFLIAAIAATVPTLFVESNVGAFFERYRIATGEGQAISYAVSFLGAVGLFLTLYRILPNANQHLRDVWVGTLTAALLFIILAQFFPIYFRVFGSIDRYDAAFGFVSLLVVWFYLLAHVLLFGTYVNVTYQRYRVRRQVARAQTDAEERLGSIA